MEKYIKNGNKKIKFKTVTKFTDRIKGFRFYLTPIEEGLCYPKKKMINTYFFCQKLDIVVTDKKVKTNYKFNIIKIKTDFSNIDDLLRHLL